MLLSREGFYKRAKIQATEGVHFAANDEPKGSKSEVLKKLFPDVVVNLGGKGIRQTVDCACMPNGSDLTITEFECYNKGELVSSTSDYMPLLCFDITADAVHAQESYNNYKSLTHAIYLIASRGYSVKKLHTYNTYRFYWKFLGYYIEDPAGACIVDRDIITREQISPILDTLVSNLSPS